MTSKQTRFIGSLEQLASIVSLTGVPGSWEAMPAGYWRFCACSGAILNWWPQTSTVNFQGPERYKVEFRDAIARTLLRDPNPKRGLLDQSGPCRLPRPR